jgi:hypothetical protein
MKDINHYLKFSLAIIAMVALQSCSDDDDGDYVEPGINFPNTVAYTNITNVDFYMWTDGAEVNTAGLSLENYLDEDDYDDLQPSAFENEMYTFTNDSVYVGSDDSESYPYFLSNDSIFVNIGTAPDDVILLGIGSPLGFSYPYGLVSYCDIDGQSTSCSSIQNQMHYDFDSASEAMGINSINDIQVGDTLIVVNQTVNIN